MDDISLREDILDELSFEPSLDAANIGVTVERGVVTLSGHVGSYAEKIAAEKAVQRVRGVRAVAEEIEVRYPNDKKLADDEIAQRALAIIGWDATVPDERIKVKVEKGWVTLSGEVQWQYQRSAAEQAVRKLSGVRGVTNLISVRAPLDVGDIRSHIEGALKRSAEVEAHAIRVGVEGGKVTLEGRVNTWHERNVVERAAWAVPGVSAVEDRLSIG